MLTVNEEFLLLTAGKRGDTTLAVDLPKSRLGIKVAMTGGSLMELALRDHIDTDVDQLWLRDASPTGEKAVDEVLAGITAILQGKAAKSPISQIIKKLEAIDSHQLAMDSLSARGLVGRRTQRFFGLFGEEPIIVTDLGVARDIRKRICDVLLEGEIPSPRDACLISLLNATRKFRRVVPAERVQQAIEQSKRYANLDLVGRNVSRHVATMIEALQKFGDIV